MGSGNVPPLRSLPRIFMPGLVVEPPEPIELPKEEVDKLRKVLRLEEGYQIAVLPNDGSLWRCEFRSKMAWPLERLEPGTEPSLRLTVIQALPKGDRLETVVRMCTELGVFKFVLFTAERSVVKWDEAKLRDRLRRYQAIVRESAEQSYRSRLPEIEYVKDLAAVLKQYPSATVLSEMEGVEPHLSRSGDEMAIVVGPEGGWAPRELAIIGDRGVTLGPLVLRTDTAAPAAAAALLLP